MKSTGSQNRIRALWEKGAAELRRLASSPAELTLSLCGLGILGFLLGRWWLSDNHANHAGHAAALAAVLLFAVIGLGFVRRAFAFWAEPESPESPDGPVTRAEDLRSFALSLLCSALLLGLILLLRALMGETGSLTDRLNFFIGIDSGCYLNIASFWYAPMSGADPRRIVFFPLYPLLVRLFSPLTGGAMMPAAVAVALLFSALSGTVLYRLLRLDYPRARAGRAAGTLFLLPGAFFLASPMSESVFLYFSLLSFYLARREKWLGAGLCGALSAFSRSLGVLILAPLLFEALSRRIRRQYGTGKTLRCLGCCLLVLCGTAAYLAINLKYYGDPLYFMKIEDRYWDQRMGLFFATSAYQIDNALADIQMPYFTSALAIWFPNVICCMGSLLLTALVARRLRPSCTLWFLVYYFVAVSPTYLISAPRYLLCAVPLFPALAELWARPRTARCLTAVCALFAAFYLYAFASSWGVY